MKINTDESIVKFVFGCMFFTGLINFVILANLIKKQIINCYFILAGNK